MKTKEELLYQAQRMKMHYWATTYCPNCNHPQGHLFLFPSQEVIYMKECYCHPERRNKKSSWEEVAKRFNNAENEDIILKNKKFWGFK